MLFSQSISIRFEKIQKNNKTTQYLINILTKGENYKKTYQIYFYLLYGACTDLGTCCNQCEHIYDNACDASCNLCGETRQADGHDFADADCTTPSTFQIYGATEGDPFGHKDANNDYICDNKCGKVTMTKEYLQTIINNTLSLSNVFVFEQRYGAWNDYYVSTNFVYQYKDQETKNISLHRR